MANRLAGETSPYLLEHADNPVDWYPWGPEALRKAQLEDKPIFLSIGYAACHWCHVMARESFEDPQIATLLNQNFVPIKVDREERPDLDSLYMGAVVTLTGQGGWPMSLFLTPDGQPFFGGTYFPPAPRQGMPSFRQVLAGVSQAWQEQRQEIDQAGTQVVERLRQSMVWSAPAQPLSERFLHQATIALIQSYDWDHGGWGAAPKFPQPMAIDFLLAQATRGNTQALQVARHALDAMARGGMYDVVGGGFHRYSTDARWLVPHFEKMLYDNALLARAYLHAYMLTHEERYRQVTERTLDFILADMTGPEGEFFSSLDADTEGVEGSTYLWTPGEIRSAISDPQSADLVIKMFGVMPGGNFDGRSILQQTQDWDTLASETGLRAEQVHHQVTQALSDLLQARRERLQPRVDDKSLTSWNGLALMAFAEAAASLERPDYLDAARRNAHFILDHLATQEGLMHSWAKGKARQPAFLEDQASLVLGMLALYAADSDTRWYQAAFQSTQAILAGYTGPSGTFFDTRADQAVPLSRPREMQDNATPSGNALAAGALLRMSAYTGDTDWDERARDLLAPIQSAASRYPTAFAFWLQDLDFALGPAYEVAVVGPAGQTRQALVSAILSTYRPRLVLAVTSQTGFPGEPPLLEGRTPIRGQPAAYVCQRMVCKLPVTTPAELEWALSGLANPAEGGESPGSPAAPG